jgi:hypothetical protein
MTSSNAQRLTGLIRSVLLYHWTLTVHRCQSRWESVMIYENLAWLCWFPIHEFGAGDKKEKVDAVGYPLGELHHSGAKLQPFLIMKVCPVLFFYLSSPIASELFRQITIIHEEPNPISQLPGVARLEKQTVFPMLD